MMFGSGTMNPTFVAMSVGNALFLILEMDGPFDGLPRVSADPMIFALEHLNQ